MLSHEKITTKKVGDIAEAFVAQYLIENGLIFVDKNFHNRQGEIDLIMQEESTIVFIEVKYRKNNNFGGAIAAIPYKKQQKIRQCATYYLQQKGLNEYNTSCRFDVVAVEGNLTDNVQSYPKVTWLKNAF